MAISSELPEEERRMSKDEVLQELFFVSKKVIPESPEEELILARLNYEPIHVDELVRLTKLDTSVINSTLTIMEMKGAVKNLGKGVYKKI